MVIYLDDSLKVVFFVFTGLELDVLTLVNVDAFLLVLADLIRDPCVGFCEVGVFGEVLEHEVVLEVLRGHEFM